MFAFACAPTREAPPPADEADPGLVHIHGLGVNPADGLLYVATHTGLFRVGDDAARRVSPAHDLMGFTVAGPNDFLASGHPDLRVPDLQAPGKPPLLGLVHSEDGEEWTSLSLLGEADFHALEAAHGKVYGWFNGAFMVSDDRRTWETRAQVDLFDFAVDPRDEQVVVGGAGEGVMGSEDGGATWTTVSDEPYVLFSWHEDGLYAVAPDGRVAASEDGGASWEERGSLGGQPEAFVATGEALYGAARGRGVLRSEDAGQSWEVVVEAGEDH